jgi:hypothetical protein
MPIHVILGKPGSGKSLYATSRVFEELATGTRNVVTNLPLHPGRLNEYLQKRYPDRDCRLIQRLRVLTDDEMREFWKYRGPEGVAGGDPEGKSGVAYFLDEAHIAFNAREWANLGKGALHYLSQHRKLGDVVWPITQAPGNLDKQFRSVAEDFTVLRNEYTAKYGPFRGRGRFVRRTYLSEPCGNAEPFEKATFTLDKEGIASCYDTAKGIGVHGNKADIGRRAKGWSIWWAFVGAFVLAGLCGLVPWLLGKGAQHVMQKKAEATMAAAGASSGKMIGGAISGALPGASGYGQDKPLPVVEPVADAVAPENPLYATGYVQRGKRVSYQLSDGRVITERDPELERVDAKWLMWKGRRVWVMPRPAPPKEDTQQAAPSPTLSRVVASEAETEEEAESVEAKPEARSRIGAPMAAGTFAPSADIGPGRAKR